MVLINQTIQSRFQIVQVVCHPFESRIFARYSQSVGQIRSTSSKNNLFTSIPEQLLSLVLESLHHPSVTIVRLVCIRNADWSHRSNRGPTAKQCSSRDVNTSKNRARGARTGCSFGNFTFQYLENIVFSAKKKKKKYQIRKFLGFNGKI